MIKLITVDVNYTVGFHRYLLEDFNNNDDKIESLTAREVKEFNASTEVGISKNLVITE